jgi:hypothetical protein
MLADRGGVGVGAAVEAGLAASRSAIAELFNWVEGRSDAAKFASDLILASSRRAPSATLIPIIAAKTFSLITGV